MAGESFPIEIDAGSLNSGVNTVILILLAEDGSEVVRQTVTVNVERGKLYILQAYKLLTSSRI